MSCLSCLIFISVYCFFPKMMKLCKGISSAWKSRTFAEMFFLKDWRHKRLKNTIDLLLFYGEYFYGFSESEYVKCEMWEFSACSKYNVAVETTVICQQFNCKHLLNVSNVDIIWFILKTTELFVSLTLYKLFISLFSSKICFTHL